MFFLLFLVPPKITVPPATRVRTGLDVNVTLTCEVSGDPQPNITWTREGATTNQLGNKTGSTLILPYIKRNDVGSYRCEADNGYGTVSRFAFVSVICK